MPMIASSGERTTAIKWYLYLREGMCSAPVKHDATSIVELAKEESALHVL
jgi:hypothetical protein